MLSFNIRRSIYKSIKFFLLKVFVINLLGTIENIKISLGEKTKQNEILKNFPKKVTEKNNKNKTKQNKYKGTVSSLALLIKFAFRRNK